MRTKTFSRRVLFSISLITSLVALGSAVSVYVVARQEQLENIQHKLMVSAKTAAQFLDPSDFNQILLDKDTSGAAWQRMAGTLRTFQKYDPNIHYIYTMAKTKDTDTKGIVQFIVDPMIAADLNGDGVIDPDEQPANIGELYNAKDSPALLLSFKKSAFDHGYTNDKWGSFISGYAPIVDSAGKTVGIVGVDMTVDQIKRLRNAFLWQCLFVIIAVIFTSMLISWLLTRQIAKPVRTLNKGLMRIKEGDYNVKIEMHSGDEFEKLADSFNMMANGIKERKRILGALERYMSKDVADLIMQQKEEFGEMKRRHVAILFCDLEKSTTYAESESPEQMSSLLSVFHERMIACVFNNHGVVNKLIGDGLMAVFGAPLPLENQEECAIRCAMDMQSAMKDVRETTGIFSLKMGIGVHAGIVLSGNIGSDQFMDYTVIGDVVNVSSRLQELSREYPSRTLCSQTVADALKAMFDFQEIGPVELKNRKAPIIAFQVYSKQE